jgi:pimeloyl-ACP methyl ester carboxylesterase
MFLEVNDREVYAYTGGKPFRPDLATVVFVHGAQHDHSVWILQSRYFAHHGFGVLAVDLPGHGRSSGPPLASIEALGTWTGAVLDAAGVSAAAIVGHSMGSLVALEAAGAMPARFSRVALLGTGFPMRVSAELLAATRDDESRALDMINVWQHSGVAPKPSNPGPGFWIMGQNLRLMERAQHGVLPVDFAACNDYAAGLARAAAIRCPVLFILGRRDVMTPPRSAQDLIRTTAQGQVVMLDSGHALPAEKPDEVLDNLVAFLARQKQTT